MSCQSYNVRHGDRRTSYTHMDWIFFVKNAWNWISLKIQVGTGLKNYKASEA